MLAQFAHVWKVYIFIRKNVSKYYSLRQLAWDIETTTAKHENIKWCLEDAFFSLHFQVLQMWSQVWMASWQRSRTFWNLAKLTNQFIQLKLRNLNSFIAYNQYGGVGHGVRYQKSAMTLWQLRSVLLLEGERDSTVYSTGWILQFLSSKSPINMLICPTQLWYEKVPTVPTSKVQDNKLYRSSV